MKRLLSFLPILFLFLIQPQSAIAQTTDSVSSESAQDTATTTLIFVRHAEKMDDGMDDPSLNEEGKVRAQRLATWLQERYNVAAIYSTGYKRTLETAAPAAEHYGLDVHQYGFDDPKGLIASFVDEYSGEAVLVVGHSNTTPYLVNIASGRGDFKQLDEKSYGKIFIVQTDTAFTGDVTEHSY